MKIAEDRSSPRYFSAPTVAKACSRTLSKFGLLAILLTGLPKELHQDASLCNCRIFNNERGELAGFLTVRDTKSRHWSSRNGFRGTYHIDKFFGPVTNA